MPARVEPAAGDNGVAVRQIVSSTSDTEFLDHLIDGLKTFDQSSLLHSLEKLSSDRDADIEQMCTSNHQEFVASVNKLDQGRGDCTSLGTDILNLVQSYQNSTDNLAAQKKNLVDSRNLRQNVEESAEALKECLEILRLANQVHDLVAKQNHYAALRALDELKTTLRVRESVRYKMGDMIEKSIPATRKMIAEAVMTDLHTWLYRIRDVSQYVGEVALYQTEQRRSRQKERMAQDEYLASFKLNSPIELVADETEEYDVLNDDDAQIHVEFTPLFECVHIHEALGQSDHFRSEYAITRRRQRDLILPSSLDIQDEEALELKSLLESIAGFAIIERATLKKTENLRSAADVDELWDSMCQSAITLMAGAVQGLENAEVLLKITGVVSLFVQTMESFNYYASTLSRFLMTLFEKYAQLLKQRCSDDFQEIVSTDDYMPMPISNIEEYDKIIDVGWYTPEKDREDITFPTVLPFSQMYPMCCIDIRNFLNQVYSAPDDYLQRSSVIDETIKNSLDELLCGKICEPLIQHLSSQYPGQIVQILTNLEHFENACQQLQIELAEFRTSRSRSDPISLRATEEFRDARKKAEKRIFELVNSKIDDLIAIAEYDWASTTMINEPSLYMTELTQYLSNIMSTSLLGLPSDIKELIYFDALSHAASNILTLPLENSVEAISPASLHRLSLDVTHLSSFVSSLSLSASSDENESHSSYILRQTVDELNQTIDLMGSENPDEFYDISLRNRKYGKVNPQNGAVLLEKVEKGKSDTTAASALTTAPTITQPPGGQNTTMAAMKGYQERAEEARIRAGEKFASAMGRFRRGPDSGDKGSS